MRDYSIEFNKRVEFIRKLIKKSGANGIVYGNSGGKDSTLVGILCKAACENTVGVIMPCSTKRNYDQDAFDAKLVADKFNIETRTVDLSPVKEIEMKAIDKITRLTDSAKANIAPRLRMTTLYAIAGAENRLVAGTGNKSEFYVGYFTKWGDGACDFNPIVDLTVTEIYEFLRFLDVPKVILDKAPSAALFEGQTDEQEMGVTYLELDSYISGNADLISLEKRKIIDKLHDVSEHKRQGVIFYKES